MKRSTAYTDIFIIPDAAQDPKEMAKSAKTLMNASLVWTNATRRRQSAQTFHLTTSVTANLDSSKSVTPNAKTSMNVRANTDAALSKSVRTHQAATLARVKRDTKVSMQQQNT